MKARFPGECVICNGSIHRGEDITDSGLRGPRGGKKMVHANCAAHTNPIPGPHGMAIPGDYPDWPYRQFGPDPQVANWTSYPQYSYEQFYRTNPEHPEVIALLKQKSMIEDELEGVPQYTDLWFELQGLHNQIDRRIQYLRAGVALQNGLGRPVYSQMPDNAGSYLPETFPYGQGGRPATYTTAPKKAKKNSSRARYVVVKADGKPRQVQIYTGPGRSFWGDEEFTTQSAVPVGEIIEMMGPHGVIELYEVIVAAGPRSTTREADRGHVRRIYKKAKRNRGSRGGYSKRERDSLPSSAFLKPSTRSWPVSDRRHAKIALQYMTRGFGNRAEYPALIRRLADHYPVEDSANRAIWTMYRKQLAAIEAVAGKTMPSMRELRARASRAAANPRRRRRRKKR